MTSPVIYKAPDLVDEPDAPQHTVTAGLAARGQKLIELRRLWTQPQSGGIKL